MSNLRTRKELERALGIAMKAVSGSLGTKHEMTNAAMAMTLAWVLKVKGPSEMFQDMIDACDARERMGKTKNRSHSHA